MAKINPIGARLIGEKDIAIQIERSVNYHEIIAIIEMDTKENALKVIRAINEHSVSSKAIESKKGGTK